MTRAKSIIALAAIAAGVMILTTIGQAENDAQPAVDPTSIFSPERSTVLAAHAAAVGHVPAKAPVQQPKGDLNADGKIDLADLAAFSKATTDENGNALNQATDAEKAAADLNDDGLVDIDDFRALLRGRPKAQQ
jgi:hypothetical protein